jgi:Rrf2 family transcriptional regulator, nitric oxide-sensitive transcriptional repressor
MRLTDFTDYGLRALIYAALHPERLVTIHEVSDAFHIPHSHLMKVVHALGKEGFLTTVRGRKGGVRLAAEPAAIRVGDVVRALEPDFRLAECFGPERSNGCVISPVCNLRGTMQRALDAYLEALDASTLADLVVGSDALRALIHRQGEHGTAQTLASDGAGDIAILHGPIIFT